MKELISKKTGKVMFVTEEVYDKLVESGNIAKYRVRSIKPLMTKPPTIIKPEDKINKSAEEKPARKTNK